MGSVADDRGRASDRWVTPGVVVVLVLAGTVVLLAVLAAVTYLTARGYDPQPVVALTGTLVAASAGVGTFLLNLAGRRTGAKTEREVGRLASGVVEVLTELDARRGRHAPQAELELEDLDDEEGRPLHPPGSADLDQDASSTRGLRQGPPSGRRYADTLPADLHDTEWGRA